MTEEEARKAIDTGSKVVAEEMFPWLSFSGGLLLWAVWVGFGFFWFLLAMAGTCLLIAWATRRHGRDKMAAHLQAHGIQQGNR